MLQIEITERNKNPYKYTFSQLLLVLFDKIKMYIKVHLKRYYSLVGDREQIHI